MHRIHPGVRLRQAAGRKHDGREHGHAHGPAAPTALRSRAGVQAVALSLGVHNGGGALTAIPLAIAFFRSRRGERLAGFAVVGTIFVSAGVAFYEAIVRLVRPRPLSHLWALAAGGVLGFVGNEPAARVRLRAGRLLASPAPARVDGFVSLGVVASAALLALGLRLGDPLVGLAITLVILRVTWQSWRTVSEGDSS
jgi:hypothetical protein